MTGMLPDTVGYLNLAYLSEISVVLNLAYRELKFPELHKKLTDTISDIKEKALELDTTNEEVYPEYGKLLSLTEQDDKFNLWENVCVRGFFYKKFLRNRNSLKVVNFSILFNVLSLILFTFFSETSFSLNEPGLHSIVFYVSFSILTIMTLLPLSFIKLSTLCEFFLFDTDDHRGKVSELKEDMFNRRKGLLKDENRMAGGFNVSN